MTHDFKEALEELEKERDFIGNKDMALIVPFRTYEPIKAALKMAIDTERDDTARCDAQKPENVPGRCITYNGKDYWPDKDGWYDIECFYGYEGSSMLYLATDGCTYGTDVWRYKGQIPNLVTHWMPLELELPELPESEDA